MQVDNENLQRIKDWLQSLDPDSGGIHTASVAINDINVVNLNLHVNFGEPKMSLKLVKNPLTITRDLMEIYTETCFSCDVSFEPEENNDREEGWFCDSCLDNPDTNKTP